MVSISAYNVSKWAIKARCSMDSINGPRRPHRCSCAFALIRIFELLSDKDEAYLDCCRQHIGQLPYGRFFNQNGVPKGTHIQVCTHYDFLSVVPYLFTVKHTVAPSSFDDNLVVRAKFSGPSVKSPTYTFTVYVSSMLLDWLHRRFKKCETHDKIGYMWQ
jgi:hypothetical protein